MIINLLKKKLLLLISSSVILGIFFLALFFTPQPARAATLLFDGNFESGNISGWDCSGNCPTVVTSPTRAGKYSVKSYLNANTSKTNYRTELVLRAVSNFSFGQEYWVGLSYYLPPDWSDKYISGYDQGMLWQFHDRAYQDPSWSGGLPLVLNHHGGKIYIRRRGHPSSKTFWEAPYEKGKWVDWVINVKFSKGSDGFINIWKGGKQIVSDRGVNYYADNQDPPYFKMGLYQWGWDEGVALGTTQRTVYHDEVRIAQGSNGYSLVAPSGSPPPGPTLPPPSTPTPTKVPTITLTPTKKPTATPTPTGPPPSIPRNAFRGQYYDNLDFTALTHTRIDPAIDFDWGLGSPAPGVGVDTFSIRWEGDWDFTQAGTYRFTAETDDGMRVWVDGQNIIDSWKRQSATEYTADLELSPGTHRIKVDYYEDPGNAVARLSWAATSTPSPTNTPTSTLLPGDINGDGVVNILDFQILNNNFGTTEPTTDINQDGTVNILDFQILNNNFGKTGG